MDIAEIQRALKAKGLDPGPVDGKRGPKTDAAIRAFQEAEGLKVDGVVGPRTEAALRGIAGPVSLGSVNLTREAILKLFPRSTAYTREAIFASQAVILPRFGINQTPRRFAYFLAQAAEESGGFVTFTENMNYSAKRMVQVWPSRFPNEAVAQPYANNPQKLANKVYGGRMGNGPETSGDGHRFRGRGPIQLTGRSNYKAIGDFIGADLVTNPDLALDPDHMMLVQAGYWALNDLNRFADNGDFRGLTKAINGGFTNMAARESWLETVEKEIGR